MWCDSVFGCIVCRPSTHFGALDLPLLGFFCVCYCLIGVFFLVFVLGIFGFYLRPVQSVCRFLWCLVLGVVFILRVCRSVLGFVLDFSEFCIV